jgi:molybdate transport system ATP-binding protein
MTLLASDIRFAYPGGPSFEVGRLSVDPGEIVAILGVNGAGKSTLLRVLAGLLLPFDGVVSIGGRALDPRRPLAHRRRIGFVFARPVRFRGSALDNAAASLVARGVARGEARACARAWLERLGIAAKADLPATTLSDGEFQRVALGRALLPGPELLFLDEPFARFDPPTREGWAADLEELAGDGNRGVLLVTQEPLEALRLARRIIVLDGGRIVEEATPDELRRGPRSVAARRLLGLESGSAR